MPKEDRITTITGTITHIFGHRFVVKSVDGDTLADLTPKGLDRVDLRLGDDITIEGERKPSEVKVARVTRGQETFLIDHEKHHPHHHHDKPESDPVAALAAARAAGFTILGEPRRKPKHFEVLGKKDGALSELHIELDGRIRKSKPVSQDDEKWSAEAGGA